MFPPRIDEPCGTLAELATAGPRYTSYPPATQFRSTFDRAAAAGALAAIPADAPVSLYCHVPFCVQLCWYCGCNVTATRDRSRGTGYVDLLIRELGLVTRAIGRRPRLVELALGGGSPNFLALRDMERLLGAIRGNFDVTGDAELGIELDPRDTKLEQVDVLAALGFTRVSVGVQDFDRDVQRIIHRTQSAAQTRGIVDRARARGFASVNLDLVYGLPGQTVTTIGRTLDEVLAMAPDRLAVFGYAHMPHLRPHQRLVERAAPVPELPTRIELLRVVMARLADAGYVRIGLDHFARPGDPLVAAARDGRLGRNFQGYVVHRADHLIGCGSSAITDAGEAYWQNTVDVEGWTAAIEADELPVARGVALDVDDQVRRFVIMRLMCEGRIDFAEVDAAFGGRFEDRFAAELARVDASPHALAALDPARRTLAASALGHHLIRNLCVIFDRYAGAAPSGSPTI